MCSPCGPVVCYKYEDCGPPLHCLPRSAFKRNGLQDCQFFQQGSIRYLCKDGPCCNRPCPPRCPPCVRRPPPGKTYVTRMSKTAEGSGYRAEEGGTEKNKEKENQLKRTKSRELRGGIMYYSCHCIKRNGLQHDCRRTGCGGDPLCLTLPDPLCVPSQLARARGLADPAVLAPHLAAQAGGTEPGSSSNSGGGSGKKFVVCELKGMMQGGSAVPPKATEKCCKCAIANIPPQNPTSSNGRHLMTPAGFACFANPAAAEIKLRETAPACCPCSGNESGPSTDATEYFIDEATFREIIDRLESTESAQNDTPMVMGPGGRMRPVKKADKKEEPCTRPGCLHWKPPPPCVWNLPCKADCFEAHPGIQPGRNALSKPGADFLVGCETLRPGTSGQEIEQGNRPPNQPREQRNLKVLTPSCCTGCCPTDGGAKADNPGAVPVLVMKLC